MSNSASGEVSGIIMRKFLSTLYGEFARRPPTRMTLLSASKDGERLKRWQFFLICLFEVESSGVVDPFIYLNYGRKSCCMTL